VKHTSGGNPGQSAGVTGHIEHFRYNAFVQNIQFFLFPAFSSDALATEMLTETLHEPYEAQEPCNCKIDDRDEEVPAQFPLDVAGIAKEESIPEQDTLEDEPQYQPDQEQVGDCTPKAPPEYETFHLAVHDPHAITPP
jgi:hypothetical protein